VNVAVPDPLQAAIDAELAGAAPGALASAAAALIEHYAHERPSAVTDDSWHAAYLAIRLPATYAAVVAALARVPDARLSTIGSLLDLGAGPGTATWAALRHCDAVTTATLVDRHPTLLAIAGRLAAGAAAGRSVTMTPQVADIGLARDWSSADLVLAAYALAELAPAARAALIASAWQATTQLLVLVEPGTSAGFSHIHEARRALLAAGAHLVAPCPHHGPCPIHEGERTDDWCHFSVRVPRTRRHRQLKGGTLGYEDEKFAYLVASRVGVPAAASGRILRHPRVEKGRIALTLCTAEGVAREVVTRRDADAWRTARKVEWGDAWGIARAPDEP